MKIRVGHSESILIAEGHWVKDEIDVEINTEYDGSFPEYPDIKSSVENNSDALHEQLKQIVVKWQSKQTVNPNFDHKPLETKIIDRSIERLEILIDDCKTKEELYKVEDANADKIWSISSLSSIYKNKLEELSK